MLPKFDLKPTRTVLTHLSAVSGTVQAFNASCVEPVSVCTYYHCENGILISKLKDHPQLSKADADIARTLMGNELVKEMHKLGVTQLYLLRPDNTAEIISTCKPFIPVDQLTTPSLAIYNIN